MKSTSGAHYVALDHIRAVAALLVFAWHFIHGPIGLTPFEGVPIWGPLVLFDEGHVGVALFMTLSGYLFAKLLDGKRVSFHLFLWNRVLRLFPLLVVVMVAKAVIEAISVHDLRAGYWFLLSLPKGLILPSWPNGGWSITAEFHFYLILPMLLFLQKRTSLWLILIIALAICARTLFHQASGEVQSQAYFTIVGRIDQFVLGMLAFSVRENLCNRHVIVATILAGFMTIYYWFDEAGGFYLLGGYPSPSSIWIILPTIEGFAFATAIAWYDTSFPELKGRISSALSKVGEYSYSIYLLHFFFVFEAAKWIHLHVIELTNFYVALLVSFLAFAAMIPLGYLSMRLIEAPFLRLRRPYYKTSKT